MTERELNKRLAQAAAHAAPDDVEAVLSRCETRKGTVIPMTTKKKGTIARNLIAACLALVLVGGGSGFYYQQVNAVASVVSLDVNPSIELKVNRNEKVISCAALNEDAALVLSDMGGGADLKGTKLDVAVNAIVGALLKNGYLDSISSAILISVEDKDSDRAAKLQQELTAAVDSILQAQASNAAVLSQTLTLDADLEQLAKANNISTGKAALVNQVLELNSALEFEKLAGLSVEELKDLIKVGAPAMPIGQSAARLAAEEYAGTLSVDSVTTDVDPELDEQVPHYEVELHHPTLGEFEYIVDAYTGEVLSGSPNILSGGGAVTITSEEAQNVVLAHIKKYYPEVDTSKASDVSIKLETDKSRAQYKVELYCGTDKFEYEIDAYTGSVLDWEAKINSNSAGGGGNISLGSATLYITQDEAKQAALAHAGLTASQITDVKVELDKDDGRAIYDVEFKAGGVKYKYEIDALNGEVWKYEPAQKSSGSSSSTNGVGESAAKTAALNHAGVTERDTYYCNVWTEYENGRPDHYQVEFAVGETKYEYEISLTDGSVLSCEQESHKNSKDSTSSSSASSSSDIGESAAKAAAFQHAGVSESQVTKLEVERKTHDGRLEYKVEFKAGTLEYEYTIDGSTGAILEHEVDQHD